LGITSAFEGPDKGGFGWRGLAGYLGLIGAVKIRIRVGSWVMVTRLPHKDFNIKHSHRQAEWHKESV
jgi:hypothetical protein